MGVFLRGAGSYFFHNFFTTLLAMYIKKLETYFAMFILLDFLTVWKESLQQTEMFLILRLLLSFGKNKFTTLKLLLTQRITKW